jgi:dienelactone hydrolase
MQPRQSLALLLVLLSPLAKADSATDWIERFRFAPVHAGADAPETTPTTELPEFEVATPAPGLQLVRVSLPFSPRAWLDSEPLGIELPTGERIRPQVRVLTRHGGAGSFVRRALLTFPHEFDDTGKIRFQCVRMAELPPLPESRLQVRAEGDSLLLVRGDEGVTIGTEGLARAGAGAHFEMVEEGPHFVWARLLLPDQDFPRVIELQADSLGGLTAAVHWQNMTEPLGFASPFGVRVALSDPGEPLSLEHSFTTGAEPDWARGDFRIRFPDAAVRGTGIARLHCADGRTSITHVATTAEEKLPQQRAAWRSARVRLERASTTNALEYSVSPDAWHTLYPEMVSTPDLNAWPALRQLTDYHRDAMAKGPLHGRDHGNIASMPASSVFGMNRLNHCPAIFQEYYCSGNAKLRDAALAWCGNFYELSIWWDPVDTDGFGGTRYNNLAASDTSFTQDPAYMWRSNSAVHFCTKGYDSFLYAYEETGDPRFATALRWQTDYAARMIHTSTGEARNIGDVRDFVRLYEMTGDRNHLEQGLRLFQELREKLSTGDLFSQSGAPIEADLPFIDDDAFGYAHPFPKPYIIGYALAGLPALAKYYPDEPKLRDVIRAVADFLARTVDPVGGWRYPDPSSSTVIIGQGMEHAAQICRAGAWLESRGENIDSLLHAVEVVLQARVGGYLHGGGFLGGLSGWEASAGTLQPGQTLHDLYKKPDDRDKRRDYAEGTVSLGGGNSPDGTVYFAEVLSFYLSHRPAERLYNQTPELRQILARTPASPPTLPRLDVPADGFGMANGLPTFAATRVAEMAFPMAWRNQQHGDYAAWRRDARATLLNAYGPPPPRTDFNAEVEAVEDRGSYEARKLTLNLSAWYRVPAYLLVPKGAGPFPAVLALHDHGAHFSIGKEKVVRPFGVAPEVLADAEDWVGKSYGGQFVGDALAARGYVVLAVDALFWGERGRKEGVAYEAQQELAANLLQLGLTWAGLITWDDVRSAEFLAALPEADPARIGAMGLSMGAHRTWSLCAATDLVKAGAAICWLGDTPTLMSPGNNQTRGQSAYSMLVPGLRNALDYADVAGIACPKPMLFFNGTQDTLFPVSGVDAAYDALAHAYESQGARDRLEMRLWEAPHEFNQEMQGAAFVWLGQTLNATHANETLQAVQKN